MLIWTRRIFLFLLTNLLVLVLLGAVLHFTGLGAYAQASGGYTGLLIVSALFGFIGSFVSLLMSKWLAKRGTGARVIEQPRTEAERWLVATVGRLAESSGIRTPQVAIFPSPDPNAFATGARPNAALVAVSEGLMRSMDKREIEAVLAHEISHVVNGDMVTMALLQGVMNTFVFFLSRVIGMAVDNFLSGGRNRRGSGLGYFIAVIASQLVLGLLTSMVVMTYSRRREYRADAGAAGLVGPGAMVSALQALERGQDRGAPLPEQLAAFGIRGGGATSLLSHLMRSHPPLSARIAALRGM